MHDGKAYLHSVPLNQPSIWTCEIVGKSEELGVFSLQREDGYGNLLSESFESVDPFRLVTNDAIYIRRMIQTYHFTRPPGGSAAYVYKSVYITFNFDIYTRVGCIIFECEFQDDSRLHFMSWWFVDNSKQGFNTRCKLGNFLDWRENTLNDVIELVHTQGSRLSVHMGVMNWWQHQHAWWQNIIVYCTLDQPSK